MGGSGGEELGLYFAVSRPVGLVRTFDLVLSLPDITCSTSTG
jgi:hypothetical protein